MYCKHCGNEIPDNSKFCPKCGQTQSASEQAYGADQGTAGGYTAQNTASAGSVVTIQNDVVNIPPEYKPISMWGYFGYTILFGLPVIGWIIALIMAFVASNINVKNFARSMFCWVIITIVLIVLFSGGVIGGMLTSSYY